MKFAAALVYWIIVALWLAVLATVMVNYLRNPRVFGTTRMLLAVIAIDTCRNLIENVYFGLFFGSQYGMFSPAIGEVLGNPYLLILPKLTNIAAGAVVLGLLLMHWLPKAVSERFNSEQNRVDLQTLATEDALTSVCNRRHFDTVLAAEWARFQRYGRPLSLLLVDVDNFKAVNDRFGHAAGDVVLQRIAQHCRAARRESDLVARVGGEEFAILLPETDESSAAELANRLRSQIAATLHNLMGEETQVTVSIGVAGATLSMATHEVLLKRADDALYTAKRAGRNRVARAPKQLDASHGLAAE